MVPLSPLPLLDLCRTRIAYLMWTRFDVSNTCADREDWEEISHIIRTQILSLHLPDQLKVPILKYVKLSGENLLFLLSLWLQRTQPMDTKKWLSADILYDCLILNGDGLINPRKTAEKILSSKMLHNVFAFRLACVNFLEVEVLKLWPHVMQYFLNKMILEGEHTQIINEDFYVSKSYGLADWRDFSVDDDPTALFNIAFASRIPYTMEPPEVLYWISYCLAIEAGTDLQAVPHFIENSPRDEYFLRVTVTSGNVAYFDYSRDCSSEKNSYIYENMDAESVLLREDYHQAWFISYYKLLSSEDRAELFLKRTRETLSRFLKWPLSFTFLNNAEEIWNLIPDEYKHWVFLKIYIILFERNKMAARVIRDLNLRIRERISGLYLTEQLMGIFVALWNISPDSYKHMVLNSCVFESIIHHYDSPEKAEYRLNFDSSELKQKLCNLFIAKGEAVLELYEGANIKESLRKLVNKYIPEDFPHLDRTWISFLDENIPLLIPMPYQKYRKPLDLGMRLKNMLRYEINEHFLIYVKNVLLPADSSNISATTYLFLKSMTEGNFCAPPEVNLC